MPRRDFFVNGSKTRSPGQSDKVTEISVKNKYDINISVITDIRDDGYEPLHQKLVGVQDAD